MADGPPAGGVHYVNENQFKVPAAPAEQQGAPAPPLGANAEPGEAAAPPQGRLKITVAAEHDADKEYLDKMRGWLTTVAALFVTISSQAMLHPPDWLKMEWLYVLLALVHVLLAETPSPRRTMAFVTNMMRRLSVLLAGTLALGTGDNWPLTTPAVAFVVLVVYAVRRPSAYCLISSCDFSTVRPIQKTMLNSSC
ncbi:uncharacterized protein C2845_PM06G05900 [Panicum miliaceum]|uniref:Uncharacterized protein n=1 Tax=Panicum miliaceum TaxID=4540 RepID=A0A3L6RBJ8_PANMI|nr:uncharacterized protein C2845_PM06G05900 [Panicum miliaceum]